SQMFTPLGMHASTFIWSAHFNPPVPTGYDLAGKPIHVYVYAEKGSGGLFATVEENARFVITSMPDESTEKKVISSENIKVLHTPFVNQLGPYNLVFDGYGFGHYIENLQDGTVAISHGGQGTGWMTHYHAVPESGDGIVILTNSQRSWPMIAYLLTDWAHWAGLPAPGMSKIILGIYLLWALVVLLWFTNFMFITRWLCDATLKNLNFKPLSYLSQVKPILKIFVSISILSGLIWAINQKYLFVTSVFPIAATWLGISLFFFALVILLSVFIQEEQSPQYVFK
ncbi:MAG TPA: serine hydrolase, partial [Anaerolineaceae bacterium]|nr:serine hydrolase [Anaerolineaceae bacterium]